MKAKPKWRKLGWRHPIWDFIRFYSVVQRQKKELAARWTAKLKNFHAMEVDAAHDLAVEPAHVRLFFDYLESRGGDFDHASGMLRTEAEALAFCAGLGVTVSQTRTKSTEHYQSSAAMVAAVSHLARQQCQKNGLTLSVKPDRRCVWLVNNLLHVTARNLDGAIPSLAGPRVVWEIKEYWGKSKGGSKMSDALYECNLVGRELREFEERSAARITHVVFLDGREQWSHRQSDLRRFIDLFHQGIIDHLIVGKEVESEWEPLLVSLSGPAATKGLLPLGLAA
jgi:hypothetical protein